jgi:hypothetical protein
MYRVGKHTGKPLRRLAKVQSDGLVQCKPDSSHTEVTRLLLRVRGQTLSQIMFASTGQNRTVVWPLDDGPSLKSDPSGGGDILAFKVNLGDAGTDGGFVRVGNGLPILSDGDVVTSAPAFSSFQGTVDSATPFHLTSQPAKRLKTLTARLFTPEPLAAGRAWR